MSQNSASLLSRVKVRAMDSVIPEDDPAKMRLKIEAEDAAFRGAMLDAIEAGLERIPKVTPNLTDGLPKRITPPDKVSGCSSSMSWNVVEGETWRNK